MTMTNLWHQLREDESGFLISSELVIIGTVGVLAMVVGLNAVSSAVSQELNDLASAFGAMDQSFNVRSITKFQHAWASGSGFNDRSDFCDCTNILQTDVVGYSSSGLAGTESAGISGAGSGGAVIGCPVIGPQRVPKEVIVEPPCVTPCDTPDGKIIDERIIRRRPSPDDGSGAPVKPSKPKSPSK